MDTTHPLALILLFLAIALSVIASLRGGMIVKRRAPSGHGDQARRRWPAVLGLLLFMNALMLLHVFPFGAFFMALVALAPGFAMAHADRRADMQKDAYIMAGASCLAWLAMGAHELQLATWKDAVVGAPIRADLFLAGPFLYLAAIKAYAAYAATRATPTPPDRSAPRSRAGED